MMRVVTRALAPRVAPAWVIAATFGVHTAAASLMFLRLAPLLHARLAASANPGHALALERGLQRLLAAQLVMPPVVPLLVAAGVVVAVRRARHLNAVRFWLAAGLVPLAIEQAGRLVDVWLADAPRTAGDVFTLAGRFSLGVRPLLVLASVSPGPIAGHWLDLLTLTAGASALAWAHALAIADRAYGPPRGAVDAPPPDAWWRAVGRIAGGWVAAGVVAQLGTSVVVPTFLAAAG